MSVSWYSINITVDSNSVFTGYFSVNNTTNVIQQFYNSNAIGTNLLLTSSNINTIKLSFNDSASTTVDNTFISGNFISIGISNIASLNTNLNNPLWYILGFDNKKGSTFYLNYYYFDGNYITSSSVTGTVNVTTASTTDPNLSTPPPVVPICFPAGTPVVTDQGSMAIEKIDSTKNTIRGKKIVAITKTTTLEDKIVCIEKDALGKSVPSQKTLISRNHKLLYNKQMTKAKHLVGKVDGVYNKKYNGEVLYNVLLETHEKMLVNNLIVETLNPENIVAKLYNGNYTNEEKNNIIVNINQCANDYKKVYGKLR